MQAKENTAHGDNETLELRLEKRATEPLQANAAVVQEIAEREKVEATLREQQTLAETMTEVTMALASQTNHAALMAEILRQAQRLVPHKTANIALVEGNTLRVVHSQGYKASTMPLLKRVLKLDDLPLNAEAMREGKPMLVPDTRQEPRWVTFEATAWIRSILGVPIRLGDRVLGLLRLDSDVPNKFSAADAERLQPLANAAAIAMENARLLATAEQRAAELEALREASLSLTSSLDLPIVLNTILERTLKLLPDIDNTHIFLYQAGRLTFGAAMWADGRTGEPVAYPRPNGLTDTVARQGELIVVPDMRTHPLFAAAPPEWQGAIVGLPLKIGQRVVGVMNISSRQPRTWPETELRVLRLLADQAAIAIENARLYQAEREQRALAEALRDTTTAIVGTLDFDEVLDRILINVGRVLPHDVANIMLVEQGVARIVRSRRYAEGEFEEEFLASNLSVDTVPNLRYMAENRSPVVVPDTRDDPDWVDLPKTRWIRSLVGAPICSRGQLIGFLNLDSATPGFFSQAQAEWLQTFADQAAVAIENARLYQAARASRARSEALRQATQAMGTSMELDEILKTILSQLKLVLAYDTASVFIFHPDGTPDLVVGMGYADEQAVGREAGQLLADSPILRQMARDLQPVVSGDVRHLDGWIRVPGVEYIRSWLGIPLVVRSQMIGALMVDSGQLDAFGPLDVQVTQTLAQNAAQAIENARLYDRVRRHAAELEQRVVERTAELQAANERLQELDQLKSKFVSNVSHELRTPLTNIKVYLYLLDHGRPEKRTRYMQVLNDETNLLQRLIEDLLDLSRLDLDQQQPTLIPIDINLVVAQLAEERSALVTMGGAALKIQAEPDLPLVRADRQMLIQIFTNLLTNAANYTPAGGTITMRTGVRSGDQPQLRGEGQSQLGGEDQPQQEGKDQQTWVTFSVSDTGPGITLEDQAHIFERFYRGEAAYRTNAPGTGLGLAICQELAERLGGGITLESQVGQGSTFTVWLPAMDT